MKVVLTEAQWTEEVNRMVKSNLFKGVKWEDTSWKVYAGISRVGATFRLSRQEKVEIFSTLFEKVEAFYKRQAQIELMNSINFPGSKPDYEGMILSRQEAIYGE